MPAGWALRLVLVFLVSMGSSGVDAQERDGRVLGWREAAGAPHVRKWSRGMLEAAPRWSITDPPVFVVVPDSIGFGRNGEKSSQRTVARASVLSDGFVVLLMNASGTGSDTIAFHIIHPASGKEVKVPVPREEDGRRLVGAHGGMAVRGDEVLVFGGRTLRSEVSHVFSVDSDGVVRGPRAKVGVAGRFLGAFPDGSMVFSVWDTVGTDAHLLPRVLSIQPSPAGDSVSSSDEGSVLFSVAVARDPASPNRPLRGAHHPDRTIVVVGDTVWVVPTERPELVAVGRSGKVLLTVEWEAGDRTVPETASEGPGGLRVARFPAASRVLAGSDGTIYVQRRTVRDDRVVPDLEWLVFSPAGELLARLEVPPNLEVLAFGPGSVVAKAQDEAGVAEIRVHTLKKPAGG